MLLFQNAKLFAQLFPKIRKVVLVKMALDWLRRFQKAVIESEYSDREPFKFLLKNLLAVSIEYEDF